MTQKEKRHWTPEDVEMLRREWRPGKNNGALAARMERSIPSVKGKAACLGLTRRRGFRPWTDEDDEKLRELVGTRTVRKVAEKLGRSVNAVRVRAKRLGVSWRDHDGWYNAQEVGEIIGVDSHWVANRIREGTLAATFAQGREPGQAGLAAWRVEGKNLRSFIRRHPHELQGRNIDIVQIVEILAGIE